MAKDAPESRVRWQLTDKEREKLAQGKRPRTYPAGDALFLEDDPSDFAILILKGLVRVTSETAAAQGAKKVLDYRGRDDVVGELSAIDHRPRSATVRAVGEVRAVRIEAKELEDFLSDNSEAMRKLLKALVGCLRDADTRVARRAYPVRCRIARGLLELAHRHGEPTDRGAIELRMSQQELADWVEVSRTAVVQAFKQLYDDALERGQYARIVIRDLAALQRFETGECPEE
jgi:CRP/FNR family transcriptional regulator, cyclic AMP receptor protein